MMRVVFVLLLLAAVATCGLLLFGPNAQARPGATLTANGMVPMLTSCTPPPSGLVSWWPGDGSANDIWRANSGTLVGGTTFAAGQVSQAFSFDGVDDYVEVPDDPSLSPATITVDAWFYATDIEGQVVPPLVAKKEVSEGSYVLELGSFGEMTVRFWVDTGGDWVSSPSVPVSANTWYHVAGTYDGSEIKIYLNGQLQGTPTSLVGSLRIVSSPLWIGRSASNQARFFEGLIDEVEIYDRALNAGEIQALYAAGSAGKCKTRAVGGIAELPKVSGSSGPNSLALVGGAAALLVLTTGTWYASRRWGRRYRPKNMH